MEYDEGEDEVPSEHLTVAHEAEQRLELQRAWMTSDSLRLYAVVHYGGDSSRYDSAEILVFYMERNIRVPNSLENTLIENYEHGLSQQPLLAAFQAALPSLPHFYRCTTRITLCTLNPGEEPTYTFSREPLEVVTYPCLPNSLISITIAFIGGLVKLSPARFGACVDRVSWEGREYAFKQCITNFEDMIFELDVLSQQPSSHVKQISGVVTDSQRRLRGFLTPFLPYGSLEEVFINLAQPDSPEMLAHGNVALPEHPSWITKLKWAKQITQGIVDLHDSERGPIVLGNLNPRNVLIDMSGDALIIGLSGAARGKRYPSQWAAPERMRSNYTVGPPLDIANLGMLLWALAEEDFTGFPYVDDAGGTQGSGRWKKREAPQWFRDVVDHCTQDDPTLRPTAAEVLVVLNNERVT